MSKRRRLVFLLVSLAILTFAIEIKAETLTATVPLTPGAEVTPMPPAPANATGYTNLTVEVNRDGAGNIVGGVVTFQTFFNFPPGPITITGNHIHEQSATANGPIVINPSLSGAQTVFPSGSGMITIQATNVDPAVLRRLIANPSRFYVNLHTSNNPGGAIRGQLTRLTERVGATVFMDPMNEVPPIPTLAASGRATITIDVIRDALGQVTGGNMVFTVFYVFPGAVEITGLHIHEQRAGDERPHPFRHRDFEYKPRNLSNRKRRDKSSGCHQYSSRSSRFAGAARRPDWFLCQPSHCGSSPSGRSDSSAASTVWYFCAILCSLAHRLPLVEVRLYRRRRGRDD